ncbi:sialidase family protein [Conexibacter sp. JD483]|uniref:sialidase family protein n=1 Tax=unclassified Conexibacter TaxID=2627773 RepID=UPI00271F2345|nr:MULTISPECIES: sialidase family protein [unclassified Conexibacter]MDO8187101.1 sialidase family protein [Conexibacter sp. CPCC 205706]MDO8200959.1 sialidase family protein [Conexibacter sp. CPCC 205762]MDR9371888.1 sialidase family protein [Conexibacter sp. JD483]
MLTTLALTAANAAAAPNLTSVRNGWITDGTSAAMISGTTVTRGGDLLVVYNNGGDGAAGVGAYLTRSSDEGASWSAPTLLRRPSGLYRDPVSGADRGSINAALGLVTLSDGTLLAPITESVNYTNYSDRESQTFVGRSTDDGVTWTGLTTPISLPTSMYFNATYGQIVQLSSGTLLMPVWGAVNRPSTATGAEDPEPWQAGVLRSFDNGRTWTDYRRIGVDPVSLPPITNPWGNFPSNVTETTIRPLRDGRLVAVMRSDTNLGKATGFWQAWSGDGGATWTDVVWSGLNGISHDVAVAPCTSALSGTGTKLIMGQTDPATLKLKTRVSFDGGWNWDDPVDLVDPSGALVGRRAYPSFVPLSGNRMFVTYGMIPTSGTPRLAYNILQDETGTRCQDQATAAAATAASTPTLFVQRADAAEWPWPYARGRVAGSSSAATLGSIAATLARNVTCSAPVVIRKAGVTLDQTRTLAALGVVNGDRLAISDTGTPRSLRVGWADLDDRPATHRVQSWDSACDSNLAIDYKQRSLALDVPLRSGQTITSVSIRDSDATSGNLRSGADYQLWTSADGHAWTEVRGWTFAATTATVGGVSRLTHTFGGLALSQRYVKISHGYAGTAWSFQIASTRNDVTVTTSP